MLRMTFVVLVGAVVAAACQSPGEVDRVPPVDIPVAAAPEAATPRAGPENREPANPLTGDPLPPLDRDHGIVALEDIHFDTFSARGSVPMTEADEALIERLRDRLPPIYRPDYESPESASEWLRDDDMVLGVADEESAFAYPHRILNFHEIVHEEVDGVPVLVSYCPLCLSGVVYDRRLGEHTLTFGNTSALYESDMVMFDWETHSYWWQVPGLAIVGELAGEALTPFPSQTMTWAEWRTLHPGTAVLSRPEPERIPYGSDPFVGLPEFLDRGETPFPTSEAARDGRLPPSAVVLGIEIGDEHRVYPVGLLAGQIVQETIGGEPVVIFGTEAGDAASAFIARAGGKTLSFAHRNGAIIDRETGSTWNRGGRATAGALAGTQLPGAPSRTTFWFAYIAAFPQSELQVPDAEPGP